MANKNIQSSVALLAAGLAAAASADPIAEWTWQVDSGFVSYESSSDVTERGFNGNIDGSPPTHLSWGGGGASSSISVTPTVSGTAATNGDGVGAATIVHDNQTVPRHAPTGVTLRSLLTFTPVGGDGVSFQPEFRDFSLSLFETNNGGTCLDGSVTECDDVLVLENAGDLSHTFQIADYEYTFAFSADGLGPLSGDACGLAGSDAGCLGFLTQEGHANTFATMLSIGAVPLASEATSGGAIIDNGVAAASLGLVSPAQAPEPASLALLSAGLVGLGLARRRARRPG